MATQVNSPPNHGRRRWAVLGVGFLVMASGFALRNGFSVFYPVIVDDFGWTRGGTAVMFSLSILVYGLLSPLVGGLVDRVKPRYVVATGMAILTASIGMCALATQPWHFYLLFGVVAACGVAMIGITPMAAIITPWFGRKRGVVFAILGSGFGVSLVSASVVQYLITTFGWQSSFIITAVAVAAISIPLVFIVIRRAPTIAPPGAQTAASNQQGETDTGTGTNVAGWRSTDWTLKRAMRTPQFWMLWVAGFCQLGLAEKVAIAHQVYFFQDAGYSPIAAASVYSVFGATFVVGNLASSLSDRLGRERVYLPGCALALGGAILLFFIRDAGAPWMAYVFAVAFGAGMGMLPPVLFAAVADLFHGKSYGAIQGMVTLGFSAGGAISPWLAGYMHDITGSYDATIIMLVGALAASGLLVALSAPRRISPVH
ncbi:MAG: MFS transporter [Chloroflexota bacterium]